MDTNEVGAMREQFANFLDYVNNKAAEAGLVSGLQASVNDLTQRVNTLEQANYQLQQALNDANSRNENYQAEINRHVEDYRRAQESADALRHTIVEADARVSGLSAELTSERDRHTVTKADLDDSRRAVSEYEQRVQGYQSNISGLATQLKDWQNRAMDWEQRATELQTKLDRVNSILSPAIVTSVQST